MSFFTLHNSWKTWNRTREPCQGDCLTSVSCIPRTLNIRTSCNKPFGLIGECSKSAAGYYESPEKPTAQESTHAANEDSASDSDADSDTDEHAEQNTHEQAEKHYAQILQIVNNKMTKVMRKNALTSPTAKNVVQSTGGNQNGSFVHDDASFSYEAPAETECSVESLIETTADLEFPTEMSVDALKTQVMRHILSVINTGTYDEVIINKFQFCLVSTVTQPFCHRLFKWKGLSII